ncbi:outer membrane receptor for ferrienterochelin and colicins [Flavobacterium nitrogenifigens]|uniref:Outer membrane receptor for ferrienterochelin and colicins n=2 Tax=Flavobacterium TaxID=237 RepID=A0A7W7J0M0_9FLAO|nr:MULTISPECIES: TonB-dependent receptor [Flavobacterium]MBB4803592.1 outer membrane receptor for ferrienterochelin and colicins [Flavobacterium nitrogenifigens]MBB6388603.1 outer membrane receptor for ferrienterochelin and colicins [Flavobacterium notoginsengisoli]
MKIKITLFAALLISAYSFAQQRDTIKAQEKLSEVVVTGQLEPQSIKKSVFNVRVISKENIKQLAANNLADVLNQYLNISVTSSGEDGRSTVSMFGLDSQYFKILIDNIPLVSDTGMGTNVDLTQVNLDDVERIEIIEGSMGVTHGANAVTGILNIITKKGGGYKWQISATLQEETVGSEYSLSNKGRHIQSAKIGHNFNEHWFVNIGGNRNDMDGFYDNRKGKDYDQNDGLRGYRQLPKEQLVGNATLGYQKDAFRIFYKFDYYGEDVHFYSPILIPQDNYPFPETYFTNDKRYITNRYYNHLNASGKLFSKLNYNISASYQKQARDLEKFNYQIETHNEFDNNRETYQSKEVWYSTGAISNLFNSKKVDFQLGYEITNENGYFDATAGTFKDENQQFKDIRKRLENYDIYSVAEIGVNEKFSLRPGLRFSFQSAFDNQYASSLGLRYLFTKGLEARASLGKSYRTPNFDELYTYFVDSNHNVQGNPDLVPENSTSYEVSFKRACYFDSGAQISNNLAVTFLDVDDRIDMVLIQSQPTLAYKYVNINKYKMWNISTIEQYNYKNWNVMFGAAVVGISRKLDLAALNVVSDDKFLYSLRLNSSVSYNISKWNTLLALYYKYNGKTQQYAAGTGTDGKTAFFLNTLEPYSMMDASIRKGFFKNQFEVTVGARNIFNVTNLQSIQNGGGGDSTGGAHGPTSSDIMLGYGRSYFLKLTYNLNFN